MTETALSLPNYGYARIEVLNFCAIGIPDCMYAV